MLAPAQVKRLEQLYEALELFVREIGDAPQVT
jgi:hypothetical protein